MKSMLRKLLLISFASLLLACSCTLTPEDKIYSDLTEKLTSVDTPENIIISNNHDDSKITLSWDPVENATYYVVEYQRTRDYLGSPDLESYYVNTNSFTLNVDSSSAIDKRYIFRVKAICIERNSRGEETNRIESDYTDYQEGVVADYISVSYLKQDNKLTAISSSSLVNSIFNNGNLAETEVRYYITDNLSNGQIAESTPSIDLENYQLSPNVEYNFTAALFADGSVTATYEFSVSGDVNYTPPTVTNLTAENNLKSSIRLAWDAMTEGAGVDGTIAYAIQKKLSTESTWSYIMQTSGEEQSLLLLTEPSYEDSDIQNDADYDYRVVTVYQMTDGSLVAESESTAATVLKCHATDTKPVSFTASVIAYSIKDNEDGTFSAQVELEWVPRSKDYLSASLEIEIYRVTDGVKAKNPISSENFNGNSVVDTIELSKEEHWIAHSYYYTIQYKYNGTALTSEPISASNSENTAFVYTVPGTIKTVNFISDFSVTDINSPLADKVEISWTASVPADLNLSLDNVYLTLTRRDVSSVNTETLLENKPASSAGSPYTDTTATPGVTYEYQLSAEYRDGLSPYNGQVYSPDPLEGMILPAPSNLAATENENTENIVISWDPVEKASGYVISYRPANSADAFVSTDIIPADQDQMSYSYTLTTEDVTPGKRYEIYIQAVDSNDTRTKQSESVYGSILGALELSVENGADYITVRWEGGNNIIQYLLVISNEDNSDSYTVNLGSDVTEYTLSADSLPDEVEALYDYPLSEKYYFAVLPNGEGDSANYRYEGSWIRAPKKITATKAESAVITTVNWESVSNADGYNVYRKEYNNPNSDWMFVSYTTDNQLSVVDRNTGDNPTNSYYEYTVATVIGAGEGIKQDKFYKATDNIEGLNDNIGFPLYHPERFSVSNVEYDGEYYLMVSFLKNPYATSYVISSSLRETSAEIFVENISEVSDVDSVQIGDCIAYENNGLITAYIIRPTIRTSVYFDVSLASRNSIIASETDNTSDEIINNSIMPSALRNGEMINLANHILSSAIAYPTEEFGGDWWQGSWLVIGNPWASEPQFFRNGTIEAAYAIGGANSDALCAYIDLKGYVYDGLKITGRLYFGFNYSFGGGTEDGFLGVDPIDYIHSSDDGVEVVLPHNFGTVTVKYNDVKADNSGGSYDLRIGNETGYENVGAGEVRVNPV